MATPAGLGVVDILRPGLPCLWCKEVLEPSRISAESLPPDQRTELLREGYIGDIDTPEPSVGSITTMLSGMAVTMFLQLMTDFMRDRGDVSRLNAFLLEGSVRRGTTTIKEACVCRKQKGFGDLRPLDTIG